MENNGKFLAMFLAATTTGWGQSAPAREYMYFGSRLAAVEGRGNTGPNDLNFIAPPPNLRSMTMKFEISDPDGGANISQLNVVVGYGLTSLRTCYFYWAKYSNVLSVNNGLYGGNAGWDPLLLGTGDPSAESENCKINQSGTGVSVAGSTLTLTVNIELRAPLGGALNVWTWGRDDDGAEIGYELLSTYTPTNSGGPSALTLLNGPPGSSTVVFQYHVTDPDGALNVQQLLTVVNNGLSGVGGCYFSIETLGNTVSLNNGKSPPLEEWRYFSLDSGAGDPIESDYCKITFAGSSHAPVTGDPNKVGFTITVQFKAAMAGAGKQVWNWTRDMADVTLGWINQTTWTIP